MNDFSKPTVATNAEFTSAGGDVLLVADGAEMFHIVAGLSGPSLLFPRTDAPAIALAILKAAGFVPSGNSEPSGFKACVETAAGHLDDAVLIQAGTAAQAELTRRRDELANEHAPRLDSVAGSNWYENVSPGLRSAIDMIIQLQDEATK